MPKTTHVVIANANGGKASVLPLAALALGMALSPGAALADGFTIFDGQVVGQQVMTGNGDVGTVEAGGTISTTGVSAVLMQGSDQDVLNWGTIDGDSGIGIESAGANAYIENHGTVSTTSGLAIYANSVGGTVVNYGTISSSSMMGYGLFLGRGTADNYGAITSTGLLGISVYAGVGTTFSNYGTIEAAGIAGLGVESVGDVFNFGTIRSENGGIGVRSQSVGNTIYNLGSIEAAGSNSFGVYGNSNGVHIINDGSISGETGILVYGGGATITNSGRIAALTGGDALQMLSGANTLNLEAGSVIVGTIMLSGTNNSLNVASGLNALVTASRQFDLIDTGSNTYVQNGNTIAVLDRAGLVLTDDMLLALADGVGAAGAAGTTECLDKQLAPTCGVAAWIGGFGGAGRVDGTDALAGRAWGHGGIETGLEFAPTDGLSAGAYVAGLSTHGEVGSSQDTDISGGAVGAHLGYDHGDFFADLSASYGLVDITSKRSVADNTVSGGLSTAEAAFNGSYFTPTLTAGGRVAISGAVLTPSVRLRYTQLSLDGYEETGANDDLVVDARGLDALSLRAQLALTLVPMLTETSELTVTLRAGADGTRRVGDDIKANLLGSDISFESGSSGESYGGFVGANLDYQLENGVVVSGDIEYTADNLGGRAATARAALSAAF